MANELTRHKRSDTVKWVIIFLLVIGIIGAVVATDGLKVELQDDAKVTYELFFYDEENAFISSTGALSTDFLGLTVPINAETAKIVITPTEDEDGFISLTEVIGYASQVTVTMNR